MKIFKILLVVFLVFVSVYFFLDRKLFYYGKNDLDVYSSLPLKIKPEFRDNFEGGFALEDEFGFFLVSKGEHQYLGAELKLSIKEVLMYGFDNKKLVAQIVDEIGDIYYIEIKRNESLEIKGETKVSVLDELEKPNFDNYTWIKIKDNETETRVLELFRNYVLVAIILLMFFFIFKIIKIITRKN